jgi:hypothetical protein
MKKRLQATLLLVEDGAFANLLKFRGGVDDVRGIHEIRQFDRGT